MTDYQITALYCHPRDEQGCIRPRRQVSTEVTPEQAEATLLAMAQAFGQLDQAQKLIEERRRLRGSGSGTAR